MAEQVDVERALTELKRAAAVATNEEEFKIYAERILYDEVISKLGLQPGRYEYTLISGERLDALYGHVLIEYKAPGKLSRPSDVVKAREQLVGYIEKEAGVEERCNFLGVILSDKIAFVRYDSKDRDWVMRGPYDLNRETVLRLIEGVRGLRRKKLAVDELLQDFGSGSQITRKSVKAFYDKVTGSKSSKVGALFNDWKRVFSQVCAYSPEKLKGLEVVYGIGETVDYNALLFSIHTYSALIMKLLGAEVTYLYGTGKWLKSYVTELEDDYMKGLEVFKRALEDLESGGVFREVLSITNFIEGDYFSWYLEELDEELAGVIAEIARRLADYEPATPVLEPDHSRDLLKRLYQNLVPKRIRHDLGEYYTPDWLAELVLNEAGITVENLEKIAQEKNDTLAPLNLRVLDPACGSGSFLILTMKIFREYAENHYLRDILADYLLKNVVGFDLNPLAVLASRTNYLLAMADLLPYVKGSIEIPIYLADSLLVETRTTLTGTTYVIRTYVGEFQMPKSIVEKGLLGRLLEAIDRYVRLRYRVEDFKQVVKSDLDLNENEEQLIGELYRAFLRLEEEGKNHVWTSIIKNAFAPLAVTKSAGKFDYVVGNPPWVAWENLPEDYRNGTKDLWDLYGLTLILGMGAFKKDMAMLFVARCMDRYVKDDGLFSFLVPFTIFKTRAGAGFRRHVTRFNVLKVVDLVTLYPFEGATNRTSFIVIKKEYERTKFPVPCTIWHNPRSGGIDTKTELNEVKRFTKRFKLCIIPVEANKTESPWMQITEKAYEAIKKVIGRSTWYKAHSGVYTGLNQIFWVKILDRTSDGYLITNAPISRQKKKVRQVTTQVEKDLVYPLIRGRDVKRYYMVGEYENVIITHDPETGAPLAESKMKINYPKAYSYLKTFEEELKKRTIKPFFGSKSKTPFYRLDNIGRYTFAPYKVVWKRVAGAITGKAISFAAAVVKGVDESKPIIPDNSLIMIPFKELNEAYYVSAVLNSSIIRLAIASYTYELRQETHITRYVRVPKFDPSNPLHLNLSDISSRCHQLASKYCDRKDLTAYEELKKAETDVDKLVAQIYDITNEELKEIKKCLTVLEGRDQES